MTVYQCTECGFTALVTYGVSIINSDYCTCRCGATDMLQPVASEPEADEPHVVDVGGEG